MLWIKAFHVIFMVTWFAGLFYLPRLFVYHAMSEDAISRERFALMERKLYFQIMNPGAVLTVVFGLWTLYLNGWHAYATSWWMPMKLALVGVLIAYHLYCGKILVEFRQGRNRRSHIWFRWFNELPALLLIAIVILAVVKPI